MANLGPDFIVNTTSTGDQQVPSVTALADGRFVAVWQSTDGGDGNGGCLRMRIYNSDGSAAGADQVVNTVNTGDQINPAVTALAGGGFVIAWESDALDGAGDKSIRARVYDAAGVAPEGEFGVNTTFTGDQTQPSIVALENGGFVVAWTSPDLTEDNSGTGIRGRLFDENGDAVVNGVTDNDSDFLINSTITAGQTQPSLAAIDGGFIVTWHSDDSGDGQNGCVRGRLFDVDGNPIQNGTTDDDQDFVLNSTVDNHQTEPAVAMLSDGRFVAAWASDDPADGDFGCIRARIFNADGTADDGDFLVNTTGEAIQGATAIAALANGGFVIAWGSTDDNDGSVGCIRARFFGSNGIPVGNDFVANFETQNTQARPSITTLSDGRVVITWDSGETVNGDGDGTTIRAAIFNADGKGVTVGGTDGDDTLTGSNDDDTLNGGKGNDNLNGLNGNDTLDGGEGDDTLNGSSGDDLLIGGAGADTIDGDANTGDGGDTVAYYQNAVGVHVHLGIGKASGGDASFDTIVGVENIIGTKFNDLLIGDDNDNEIHALEGADTIDGGAGNDKIMGGAGADIIDGGAGDHDGVSYEFSAAGVTLALGVNGAVATGSGAGSDALGDKVSNAEIVLGSNFNDKLTGNALNNTLIGGAGIDILVGGAGDDELQGDAGADTLTGGLGNDTVSYDEGFAPGKGGVSITLGTNGALSTGSGGTAQGDQIKEVENVVGTDDTLNGDTIIGNNLDNIINGMSGGDDLVGGLGNDTLSYEFSVDAVTVTLNASYEGGHAQGDEASGFENIIGGGNADEITGDDFDNVIEGREKGDTLDGGLGNDTLSYRGSDAAVSLSLFTSSVFGGHGDSDFIANFENVLGSAFDDELIGSNGKNVLTGGAGNDFLQGGKADDTIDGGAGARDLVSFNDALTDGVTLTLGANGAAAQSGTNDNLGTDTISNVEDIEGSDFIDKFTGNNLANIIEGGFGADILDGGLGNDTLSYAGSDDGVNVTLALSTFGPASADGDAEGDTNKNFENLRGSEEADTLTGNAGANVIEGGDSGDLMDGGAGIDTLSYEHSNDGVTVELGETGDTDEAEEGDAENDVGTGFENLIGSNFGDDLDSDHDTAATVIDGRGGADFLDGTDVASGDTLIGGDGDDNVSGRGGVDKLFGNDGNDDLEGDDGNDAIDGGDGDDVIGGGAGADKLDGGAGMDRVEFSGSGSLTINLAKNTVTGSAGSEAKGDTIKNFEHVRANISGNANITGTAGYNELRGGDGDDTIEGGGAGDLLNGGDGTNDTASYKNSALGVIVDIFNYSEGRGFAGDADGDKLENLENFTLSGKDDLFIDDLAQNGTIDAGAGVDTISYKDQLPGVGVAINLGVAAQGGGDNLIGFENIIGSDDVLGDSLTGNAAANLIEGGGGADVLDGGAGIDTLTYKSSASGVDVVLGLATFAVASTGGDAQGDTNKNFENLIGSEFADANLSGNSIKNKIEGLGGDDFIFGGGDIDTLLGGDGDDNIMGHVGADIIDGGAGFDYVSYTSGDETVGITIVLGKDGTKGTAKGGHAEGDQITNVEGIIGSAKNDTLTGNNLVNELYGGDGDDTIQGFGDGDTLDGEGGIDTLSYAQVKSGVTVHLEGNTTAGAAQGDKIDDFENLIGTAFDDTLVGLNAGSKISGGGGNDFVVGGAAASNLDGGTGNDTIFGGDGIDTIFGGDGDDEIVGSLGADTLDGGKGLDTLSYEFDLVISRTVTLVAGQKAITSAGDNATGFENIIGSAANDKLTGDTGNNVIEGVGGADEMDGGAGTGDTLSYESSAAGVNVTLSLAAFGAASTGGDAAGDTNKNFENLIGSANNDTLQGNSGANNIQGGDGVDTLTFGGATGVTVDLSKQWTVSAAGVFTGGVAGIGGEAAGDKYAGFEDIIGTTGNDKLTGDANINFIDGGKGDDIIEGGDNGDTLVGGDNGAGGDTLSYAASTGGITLFLGLLPFVDGGHASGDTISGFENIIGTAFGDLISGDAAANKLSGGDGNDSIGGDAGDDVIDGGKGDDSLDGGADKDTLTGGDGNDLLQGGTDSDTISGGAGDDLIIGGSDADVLKGETGVDTLIYAGSGTEVTVTLNGATLAAIIVATGGHADGDKATGFENLTGSDQNDKLTGDAVANVLEGGNGNDVLDGAAGNDTLNGGNDSDTINGNIGDDVINGGDDADDMDGGVGTDTLTYAGSGGVLVNLSNGFAQGDQATGDTFKNFENLRGTSDADTLTGDANANKIEGGADGDVLEGAGFLPGDFDLSHTKGNDTVNGDAGADTIGGGLGSDTLDGGAHGIGPFGGDTISYRMFETALTITLGAQGVVTNVKAGSDTDRIKNFENAVGGLNNDVLNGNDDFNLLGGEEGDDILTGNGGDDGLTGGAGDDILVGGKGNDAFFGKTIKDPNNPFGTLDDADNSVSGFDTVIYGRETGTNAVSVNLADEEGTDTFGDTDFLEDIEIVFGSQFNDTLIGSDLGANSPEGFGGLEGADIIDGGADLLDNHDEVRYDRDAEFGGKAGVTVNLTNSDIVNQTFNGTLISIGKNSAKDGFGTFDSIINIEGIRGTAKNDFFFGTTDNDQGLLKGLGGNDYLSGSGDDFADYGSDREHGGDGRALVNLSGITLDLHASATSLQLLATGKAIDGFGTIDTIVGLNNIQGTNSVKNGTHALAINDVLVGNGSVNQIRGFDGNDSLVGLADNDILDGGDGDFDEVSHIYDDAGGVTVNMSSVTQGIVASKTAVDGLGGTDTLIGIEAAAGGIDNDLLFGGFGANRFYGYSGNDKIDGTADVGDIDGVTDLDIVEYGRDNLLGGTGAITVDLSKIGANATDGFGDADTLIDIEIVVGGKASADKLTGGDVGNSSYEGLAGLGGADILNGGADGFDEVRYDFDEFFGGVKGITVNLATGKITDGFGAIDTVSNFESIRGTSKADTFNGAAAAMIFRGVAGADKFVGGAGLETIDYSVDHEHGATHGIIANLSAATQVVDLTLIGKTGTLSVAKNAVYDAFSGAKAVFDTVTANTIENVTGTKFNDVFFGSAQNNVLNGGGGIDTVIYTSAVDAVVTLDGTATQGGDTDTLINIENATTGAGADILQGNALDNVLRAGGGKDVIFGGLGADIIDGGADTDMVDYSADAGTHGVIVNLSSSTITLGNLDALDFGYTLGDLDVASNTAYDVGNNDTLIFDTLISIEYVTGTGFKDVLIGSDFNNRLVGGGGADILTGGAGGDGFQYNFASEGGDTITDFNVAEDFIRINQFNFGIAENEDAGQHPEAAAGIEQLAANYFVLGNTATEGGHGQFIYDGTTGELFWDDDGTGGNAQVLLATLQGTPSLTINDILLI